MIWVWLNGIIKTWRFFLIMIICPHMDKNEYGNRICLISKKSGVYVKRYEWCEKYNCPKLKKGCGVEWQ